MSTMRFVYDNWDVILVAKCDQIQKRFTLEHQSLVRRSCENETGELSNMEQEWR